MREGWTRVAFGDVVRLSRERSSDPIAEGFDRYVGLEHLDPGDLKIRRWGNTADGTTFTNVFRPGQVLFGKRRAYQGKVAVADFEGVCSGDIYVLEPSDDRLDAELLPLICRTRAFLEHAVGTSAGSLSPRTNWTNLAAFATMLPYPSEQRKIVCVIEAAREAMEAARRLAVEASKVREAARFEMLVGLHGTRAVVAGEIASVVLPAGWDWARADELCSAPVTSGSTPRDGELRPDLACPFIKVGNLTFSGALDFGDSDSRINRASFAATSSLHVTPGDVLTNIVGPPLGKVSIVPPNLAEAHINQAIVRFRPRDAEIGIWIGEYLMSRWAKAWLYARSKKTSGQRNINATTCASLPVPMPPRELLSRLVEALDECRNADAAATLRQSEAEHLVADMIEGMVGNALL